MDHEEIPSMPSTPATTPGTPGAPLFGGFEGKRKEHNGKYTPKSLLKSCKCFSVDNEWALEDGRLPPVSCSLPPPNVSLYRKVHIQSHRNYTFLHIHVSFNGSLTIDQYIFV